MKKRIYGGWLLLSAEFRVTWEQTNGQWSQSGPKAGITIRVLNPASIPAGTLRKAEQMAGDVLDAAGIEITWLRVPVPAGAGPQRVLAAPAQEPAAPDPRRCHRLCRPDAWAGRSRQLCRCRVAGGGRGCLQPRDLKCPMCWARRVAHEIGHILLGSKAHTRGGIMSSRFERAEMRMAASGELRFSPEQAQRMRANAEASRDGFSLRLFAARRGGVPRP